MVDSAQDGAARECPICLRTAAPAEVQRVRCNVRRFRDRTFLVWRCTGCGSLHCEKVENLAHYYADYPIRKQELDYFLRAWYRVILGRLVQAGLEKRHRILDYGCSKGLFIRYLQEHGYSNCFGFDPYVDRFKSEDVLEAKYDFIVSLDVIEHDENPRQFLARLVSLLLPRGRLCLETPNAEGIVLADTEEYLHALHVPYHTHILSQRALADLSRQHALETISVHNRWYMDSWPPGTARRLFEPLMKFGGNDLDLGYEPPRIGLFFRHPSLFFHLFFGYFFGAQKQDHMMMIFRA
jgi:2-polyprenyl-3-methyl-5-hydroxy-6-metoxy-1,4-benzoquinol methylase